MTIALVIKVNDGLVLAADSATTMFATMPDGSPAVTNIYNNANKVFNLHKGLPIGAMTWGLGNIGPASIATIAKDMRQCFHADTTDKSWKVDPDSYEIGDIAQKVHKFIGTDRYAPMVAGLPEGQAAPYLGFLTAGYSTESDQPRVFVLGLGDGSDEPVEVLADDTGAMWWGQPEAISRILTGVSLDTPAALVN